MTGWGREGDVATARERPGESGLTMLEVLVGIVVLAIGLMSMLAVFFSAAHFSASAAQENTACRISAAVFDYCLMDPDWATAAPRTNNALSPIVTPDENLVWELSAQSGATHHPGDASYTGVWRLRLRIAADSNDNGTYEPQDWTASPVRPRGFVNYGTMDATCETYLYKK